MAQRESSEEEKHWKGENNRVTDGVVSDSNSADGPGEERTRWVRCLRRSFGHSPHSIPRVAFSCSAETSFGEGI